MPLKLVRKDTKKAKDERQKAKVFFRYKISFSYYQNFIGNF